VLFLSYASEDAERVEAFYNAFKAAGLDPWMDRRDLTPGAVWAEAVLDAIARCDQYVFFSSRNSATKRGFLQREIKRAQLHWEEKLEDDLYVVPVRLDSSDMPPWLDRFQRYDAFDDSRIPQLIHFLLNKRIPGPAPTSRLRQTLDFRMVPLDGPGREPTSDIEAAIPHFFAGDGRPLAKVNELIEEAARPFLIEFQKDAVESQAWLNEEGITSRDGLWIEPTVTTATRSLVSLEFYVSTYLNRAAHRGHVTRSVLIDVEATAELSLSDILKDEKSALEFFSRYCAVALRSQWELDYLAYYGQGQAFDPAEAEQHLQIFDRPDPDNFRKFVFRDNSLVFIFDPYHVGPYAFGRRTVALPFNDMHAQLTSRMTELLIGRRLD
jgi:hypothetical protein